MAHRMWTGSLVLGICVLAFGLGALYSESDFISSDLWIVAIFAGLMLSFIAVIGWSRPLTRESRLRIAGLVFALPLLALVLANQIQPFNVHGPSIFLAYLVIPVSWLLAIVLLSLRGAPPQKP